MLKLELDRVEALKFYEKIKCKIEKNIDECDSTAICSSLQVDIKNKLDAIITAEPEELKCLNDEFIKKIIPNYDADEFLKYRKLKEKVNWDKYHKPILEIKKIFDYTKIVGNEYYLAEVWNRSTCTYCNRNYTITVGNTNKRTTRPDYDHWFNKDSYPLLAVSFYNLIPSCPSCNKKKSNIDFDIEKHIHPYLKTEDEAFKFSYRLETISKSSVTINTSNQKIIKTFNELNLTKIYNAHSNKELKDLLDLRYKYSENYIDILINKTFKGIMSKEEIYRMIFGIETKEEDYHKRPFSKFKHDIIEELKNIK